MKKIWDIIGAGIGLFAIFMGIIFIFTPAETYSTESLESISFGGDYYTYEYKATITAAKNASVVASNLRELGGKLALYVGMAFILTGALTAVHFGKNVLSFEKSKAKVKAEETDIPKDNPLIQRNSPATISEQEKSDDSSEKWIEV